VVYSKYAKKYYEKNKEHISINGKKYYEKNKEHHKKISNNTNNKIRRTLLQKLGMKCIKCGFSDERILQIDHKEGGGLKEIKKFKTNYGMYKYYLDHPELIQLKLQTLCPNCNWIKRIELHENRS